MLISDPIFTTLDRWLDAHLWELVRDCYKFTWISGQRMRMHVLSFDIVRARKRVVVATRKDVVQVRDGWQRHDPRLLGST